MSRRVTRSPRPRFLVGYAPPDWWGDVHDPRTEQAVRKHLDLMRLADMSETTVYSRYRSLVRLDHYFGGRSLLELTEDDLLEWLSSLNLTPATVVHYVSHAHAFYAWAVDYRVIAENPADRLPVPRRARRLPRPIGEDDLDAAVQMAPHRVRPWLVLAGWAGLRAKEIAYLQRENVLDTAPMPHILIVSTATKGRDERCVPLNEYVIEALYEHGLPNTGYCFRRRDGQVGPNFPWTISELANTHLRACGIPATLHQLRHRALTQLYAETLDILLVQKIAGHHDPATTAGYAAISDTKAAEAMSRLRTPPRMRAVASAQ